MKEFITRVELGAAASAYERLDYEMLERGFDRVAPRAAGRHELPLGTYYSRCSLSVAQVDALAQSAASVVAKRFWTLAIERSRVESPAAQAHLACARLGA